MTAYSHPSRQTGRLRSPDTYLLWVKMYGQVCVDGDRLSVA